MAIRRRAPRTRTVRTSPTPVVSLKRQAQERLKQARATPTLGGRKVAPNPKASFAEQKKAADAARLRYGQEIAEAAKKQPVQQAKQISMAEMKKLQAQKASAIGAIGTGAIGKAKPKMNARGAISAIGAGITGKAKRKTKGMA